MLSRSCGRALLASTGLVAVARRADPLFRWRALSYSPACRSSQNIEKDPQTQELGKNLETPTLEPLENGTIGKRASAEHQARLGPHRIRRTLSVSARAKPKIARKVYTTKSKPSTIQSSGGNKTANETPEQADQEPKVKDTGESAAADKKDEKPKSKPAKKTKASKKPKVKVDIQTITLGSRKLEPLSVETAPVPRLEHGLERVLFNPGVYQLQDNRSRVFNFDPYLQSIMPVSEFDFNALKEYVTSSHDTLLSDLAQKSGSRYVGSTSSMTSMLSHFHFLLSRWREPNFNMLTAAFPAELKTFTQLSRAPAAVFLKYKNGTYAIDADKEFATANILSMLGKSMEKLLTLKKEDFERYRKSNPSQISDEEKDQPEAFHFSTFGDFLMRSQLDAYDARLPGTGMFDLKTRAVLSIRMNVGDYENLRGYEITDRNGEYESFEREYHDLIRAAFLKYSLQVRMGRMDGIFVAYHNTERIFGFQYVSINEMDLSLHGQSDTTLGDMEFKFSLDLLNRILEKATKRFPGQSLRLHFETREASTPFMYIFAEPVTDDDMNRLQSSNEDKIRQFEADVLGIERDSQGPEDKSTWEDVQEKVEESMDKEEADEDVDEATAQEQEQLLRPGEQDTEADEDVAREQEEILASETSEEADELSERNGEVLRPTIDLESGVDGPLASSTQLEDADVQEKDAEESEQLVAAEEAKPESGQGETFTLESIAKSGDLSKLGGMSLSEAMNKPPQDEKLETKPAPVEETGDILAFTLTVRNKVRGRYVDRPNHITASDDQEKKKQPPPWAVEYSLVEIEPRERAWKLYRMCQTRRSKRLQSQETEDKYNASFFRMLRRMSKEGRRKREQLERQDRGRETVVLGRSAHDDFS